MEKIIKHLKQGDGIWCESKPEPDTVFWTTNTYASATCPKCIKYANRHMIRNINIAKEILICQPSPSKGTYNNRAKQMREFLSKVDILLKLI